MDEYTNKPSEESSELDSLEGGSTIVTSAQTSSSLDAGSVSPEPDAASRLQPSGGKPPKKPHSGGLRGLFRRFNIYLLLFLLILIVAIVILVVTATASHNSGRQPITSQNLSAATLKQLASSDVTVGDPKQVLSVQSNAIFAGKVLVRDSLDVAGDIHIGGALSLPGISVSGKSSFEQVQVNRGLDIGGNAGIQGQLSVQQSLSVAGNGTFGGTVAASQLHVSSLQLNGDLNLTHHLVAGGAAPGRAGGSALGAGGTSSVSGSDTGGSVNVNTGGNPAAGCFVTVSFSQRYNATPHVLVTPVGSAAGALAYYVDRGAGSFSICTASAPPAGSSFGFDYFVVG